MRFLTLPSSGFVLVAASWLALVSFFVWGLREPELLRLGRQLENLELGGDENASKDLVRSVRQALRRYPKLSISLAGSTGARLLEGQRDGWARISEGHVIVALGKQTPGQLRIQCDRRTTIRIGRQSAPLQLTPKAPVLIAIPSDYHDGLLTVVSSTAGSALRIEGVRSTEGSP